MRQTLLVMRAAEMKRVHPQTDWSFVCGKCGAPVGIYPSGQAVIERTGVENVDIVCNRCMEPGLYLAEASRDVAQEIKDSIPNPRL